MIHSKNGVSFTEQWIWSDGCAGQFKSAHSFYWLSHLHKETGIRHTWIFFETGHGKGEHDGVGACVKRALRRYQMSHSASRLKCSKEVVDWCTQNLGHQGHEQARPVQRYKHFIYFKKQLNWNLINVFTYYIYI